jgi:hypothetical protein
VTFDREVKSVLRKRCGSCHNAERPRGELDLSTAAGVAAGGAGGKVAVAGRPEESPLYLLPAHLDEPAMPPNAPKIPQRELDLIRQWIEGGLVVSPADARPGAAVAANPDRDAKLEAAGGLGPAAVAPRPTPVTALAASPVAPLAAVAGGRQVLLFDLAARTLKGAVPFPEGDVLALRFSSDGRRLLAAGGVGAESGQAAVYDTANWARLATVGDETDQVLAADLNGDGSAVVLGGPPRVVKLFGLGGGLPTQVHALRKATDWITAASFSPDGLLVAAGDRFGGLFLWEARTGHEFLSLRGHTKGVTGLGWAAGGDQLISAGDDGTVRVWDLHQQGKAAGRWECHDGGILGLDVHPSGRVVTGGRDRRLKVWRPDGQLVAEAGPMADELTRVAWVADGRAVVYGDAAGEAGLWAVSDPSPALLPMPVAAAGRAPAVITPVLAPARRPAPRPRPAAGHGEALTHAGAALRSLRSALAADPGNEALHRALGATKAAVDTLERARNPGAANGEGP